MFCNPFSSTTIGDENPICTLGDYSKPSHEGYKNTIELPVGNNVVPVRSDTIRLVQNGCSFHGLQSEDPNQHLKDFLKLVDSLDLDGSITKWEDLTTCFLAQFFPPRRTAKLRNDILMFQQHHGESLSEAWTRLNPQLQALGTTFEARVRDYMEAHTERIERFENAILKQREEINDRMNKIEEAKSLIVKSVNSISLVKEEEGKNDIYDVATSDDSKETDGPDMEVSVKEAKTKNDAENEAKNKPIKKPKKEGVVDGPSYQPVEYYLKHRINEKLSEGLVDNNRFNDSLSRARAGKKKGKTYHVLPRGPVYEAILKKKITKEDIGGNFEIPCSIGGLKHMNALVDQGSDVNVMPYSTYIKLIDERLAETEIRLSLASHSYIYPLGIAGDVLVEIVEHVYHVYFVILDIKEDEMRPFILGTPFLTTAKAVIKFDKGTITLRSGKSKISFHRIPESPGTIERGVKNNIEPIAPTMIVNRLVLEWEERIRFH
ncbi:zinc finger, CCHC-type containing protein [Tanacetum coccineum]